MIKPSNYPTKIQHLTHGGGTPICEQLVNGGGRPNLQLKGNENSTLASTSMHGSTSNQKVFFKCDVCHSKWYVSCVYDYQVFIYLFSLLENHHENEQQVHWARKF